MQVGTQDFLDLVEESSKICFFDIESTGLGGDYNSVLVVSIKPFGKKAKSFYVKQPGYDIKVVKDAKEELEKYICWVSYYGKGFDVKMLNTRLLRWKQPPLDKRHHIDLYFSLASKLLTKRKSQAHLLGFLECDRQKMSVSAEEWNKVVATGDLSTMISRCESDTEGLESLYKETRHLINDIKCG